MIVVGLESHWVEKGRGRGARSDDKGSGGDGRGDRGSDDDTTEEEERSAQLSVLREALFIFPRRSG